MNDFTKEELESMLNWGDVYSDFGNCWSYKINKPIMDKIQAMIENYCTHEGVIGSDFPAHKCMDCGAYWE